MTFEQIQKRFDRAIQFRRKGELTEALRLLNQLVLDIQDEPGSGGLRVQALLACGEIAEEIGYLPLALKHYGDLKSICYAAGNRYACADTQLRLARVLTDGGRFDEAEQQIDGLICQPEPVGQIKFDSAGMERWETRLVLEGQPELQSRPLLISAWREIGRCRAARGRYGDAIKALLRALHHCGLDPAVSLYDSRPAVIVELASAYFESGDFRNARAELAKLPASHSESLVHVVPLEIRSRIDVLEGVPGKAVKNLQRAFEICAQARRTAAAYTEMLNLAGLLISLNQLSQAEQRLVQIPPEVLSDEQLVRLEDLLCLSQLRAGTVSRAQASAESSTEMWDAWNAPQRHEGSATPFTFPSMAQGSFLTNFEARTFRFYALLGEDDYTAAGDALAQLQRDFGDTDSRLVQARLGYFTGLAAYYARDLKTARLRLEASANAFHDMGDLFDHWQALRAWGWACMRDGCEDEAARHREHSDSILERIADSLGPVDGATFLLNKWPVLEEHLSRELRKIVKAQKELRRQGKCFQRIDSAMRYIDAHRLLVSRSHGLEAKLREYAAAADVARETSEKPVLRFVVLPDRLVCIVVHGQDARILESEVNRVGIRNLVKDFHENIRVKPAKLVEADRKLAEISKAILLPELTGDLPADIELRLLPDDCLHGIPFTALPLADGTLLGDRFPVSIGSDWQTTHTATDDGPPRSALLMALRYEDIDGIDRLDGTQAEIDSLLRQQPFADIACDCLAEEAVSVPELLARLPDSDYVHMACHGIFYPNDPAASGLLIYTGQTREVLSASKLSEQDLSRVRHFALSSCWSADDYASPGRYIVSLPETLLRAGVRTVLGSLWPVTDAVGRNFMAVYYKELANASPAKALQAAQKALRAFGYTASYVYWAGYRVYTAS